MSLFSRNTERSAPDLLTETDHIWLKRNLDLAGVVPEPPRQVGLFRLGWRYFDRLYTAPDFAVFPNGEIIKLR